MEYRDYRRFPYGQDKDDDYSEPPLGWTKVIEDYEPDSNETESED